MWEVSSRTADSEETCSPSEPPRTSSVDAAADRRTAETTLRFARARWSKLSHLSILSVDLLGTGCRLASQSCAGTNAPRQLARWMIDDLRDDWRVGALALDALDGGDWLAFRSLGSRKQRVSLRVTTGVGSAHQLRLRRTSDVG